MDGDAWSASGSGDIEKGFLFFSSPSFFYFAFMERIVESHSEGAVVEWIVAENVLGLWAPIKP
mgnify:CR=1 FL=1